VVPFQPDSTTIVARIVTDQMADAIGQQFVVENRGGAGGTLGTRQVAKSAPDGYTIALGYSGTLAIAPSPFPNAGYDVRTDFAPIGRIGGAEHARGPSIVRGPFRCGTDRLCQGQSRQSQFRLHRNRHGWPCGGRIFCHGTGIKLTHIPYKGTGPAMTDLLGGHIPLSFSPIPAAHESARSGLLRMLAVTSATRSTLMPDIPTVAESGVPGFEAVLRYGLVAPAGTPRPIIDRLNKALQATLASDEVRSRLAIEGAEPLPSTPEEYAADIDHEEAQWSKVIKASGAKAE